MSRRGGSSATTLSPQPQLFEHGVVALDVPRAQVSEVPAPLTDELQQPAARVIVVLVLSQVVRQPLDAVCEQRDLHLWRPRVAVVARELAHQLLLAFLRLHFRYDFRCNFRYATTATNVRARVLTTASTAATARPGLHSRMASLLRPQCPVVPPWSGVRVLQCSPPVSRGDSGGPAGTLA